MGDHRDTNAFTSEDLIMESAKSPHKALHDEGQISENAPEVQKNNGLGTLQV